MAKLSDLYPSKYLKAEDLPEEGLILTIRDVTVEKMRDGTSKPIVYFDEIEKGLACNKTNAKTISKMYGDDTDQWEDERISLFPTTCDFGGETTDCIRVKPKKPKAEIKVTNTTTGKTSKVAAPAQDEDDEDDDDTPF